MSPPVADKDGSSCARFTFLCAFSEELVKTNMQFAQYSNGLNLSMRNTSKAFGIQITNQKIQNHDEPPQKRCCQLCPKSKDRKICGKYSKCKKQACKEHSKELIACYDCFGSGQN